MRVTRSTGTGVAFGFWRGGMRGTSQRAPVVIIALAVVLVGVGVYLFVGGKTKPPAATEEGDLAAQPSREVLDRAIARGKEAFLRDYVRPSWEAVSNGGYVEYTNAVGETQKYGPNAYVACQIYLLTHYLMYTREFGVTEDDPLLAQVRAWFVERFDAQQGRWVWSEEGCLHAKGMIALARHGRSDLAEKAWTWAKQSPLWLPERHVFTMMQSGKIIQTLGSATLSMSGKLDWEHGSPIPDAENSSKYLYALLLAGRTADDPEAAELNDGINAYFEGNTLTFAQMETRDVIGMVWYVYCHHAFDLEKRGGYRFAVETMREGVAAPGQLRKHGLTEHFTAVRGKVIKALLMAGERTPAMNEQINVFLERQAASGGWPLSPAAKKAWGLDAKPVVGIKMGQMDGANTYLTAMALMAYREAVYGAE